MDHVTVTATPPTRAIRGGMTRVRLMATLLGGGGGVLNLWMRVASTTSRVLMPSSSLSTTWCKQCYRRSCDGLVSKHVRTATVHELRSGRSDRSQKQADLVSDNLAACGTRTLIDVGLAHTLNDTYLSNKSKTVHAKAANAYAKQKRTGYEKEIAEKSLDYLYRSFCLEPLGAFGDDAWRLIREVCGRDHPHAHDESCMWRRPDPKKDFVLSIAFALQRGNANTLMAAASRRRDRRTKAVIDPSYYPSSSDDEIEA